LPIENALQPPKGAVVIKTVTASRLGRMVDLVRLALSNRWFWRDGLLIVPIEVDRKISPFLVIGCFRSIERGSDWIIERVPRYYVGLVGRRRPRQ
jgi:hypothetical protein